MKLRKLFSKDKKDDLLPFSSSESIPSYQQPPHSPPSAKPKHENKVRTHTLKIILIGNPLSHKSSLFSLSTKKQSSPNSLIGTIGVKIGIKTMVAPNGDKVKLQIHNVTGPERFGLEGLSYHKGAHGLFLCYDPSNSFSFEYLWSYVYEFRYFSDPNVSIRLLGISLKSDDNQVLSHEEVQSLADEFGAKISSCCLSDKKTIDCAFDNLVTDIYSKNDAIFDVDNTINNTRLNVSLQNEVVFTRNEGVNEEYLFKIVIIGTSSSHKTALFSTYIEGISPLDSHINTIGVNFKTKTMPMSNGDIVSLIVWNTAEPENFASIAPFHIRSANGILLCYDPSDLSSFGSLKAIVDENIDKFVTQDFCVYLLGISLRNEEEERVPREETYSLATLIGAKIKKCCLKDIRSVNDVFYDLTIDIGLKEDINFNTNT